MKDKLIFNKQAFGKLTTKSFKFIKIFAKIINASRTIITYLEIKQRDSIIANCGKRKLKKKFTKNELLRITLKQREIKIFSFKWCFWNL